MLARARPTSGRLETETSTLSLRFFAVLDCVALLALIPVRESDAALALLVCFDRTVCFDSCEGVLNTEYC